MNPGHEDSPSVKAHDEYEKEITHLRAELAQAHEQAEEYASIVVEANTLENQLRAEIVRLKLALRDESACTDEDRSAIEIERDEVKEKVTTLETANMMLISHMEQAFSLADERVRAAEKRANARYMEGLEKATEIADETRIYWKLRSQLPLPHAVVEAIQAEIEKAKEKT